MLWIHVCRVKTRPVGGPFQKGVKLKEDFWNEEGKNLEFGGKRKNIELLEGQFLGIEGKKIRLWGDKLVSYIISFV